MNQVILMLKISTAAIIICIVLLVVLAVLLVLAERRAMRAETKLREISQPKKYREAVRSQPKGRGDFTGRDKT